MAPTNEIYADEEQPTTPGDRLKQIEDEIGMAAAKLGVAIDYRVWGRGTILERMDRAASVVRSLLDLAKQTQRSVTASELNTLRRHTDALGKLVEEIRGDGGGKTASRPRQGTPQWARWLKTKAGQEHCRQEAARMRRQGAITKLLASPVNRREANGDLSRIEAYANEAASYLKRIASGGRLGAWEEKTFCNRLQTMEDLTEKLAGRCGIRCALRRGNAAKRLQAAVDVARQLERFV